MPGNSSEAPQPLRTILLVDANPPLRILVRRMLQHHGYLVLEVSNPEDLLKLPGAERIHFDALVSELSLPQMTGPDLADRLAELGRTIPVLYYSSGYRRPPREFGPHEALLLMPFGMRDFLTKLEALIAGVAHPPPSAPESRPPSAKPGHLLKIYETPDDLARTVAPFLMEGLNAGERVTVIATPEHWRCIAEALREGGTDPAAAKEHGKLDLVDAGEALKQIPQGPGVNPAEFNAAMSGWVAGMARGGADPQRIYGEVVDLLWQRNQLATAVALEGIWNRHLDPARCRLLCGYHRNLVKVVEPRGIVQVLESHSHVVLA